jgi:thiosulfate/3-mercaptopyruvate sulfurtransferase
MDNQGKENPMIHKTAYLLLALPFAIGVARAEDAYPRTGLLIEPGQLAKAGKRYVILDARPHKEYTAGHVPGARWVDRGVWAKAFAHGEDARGWGKRIGGLGIGPDSRVVVYDANYSKDAARIWWILKYWGVEDAHLLNGGWVGWKAGGYPVQEGEVKPKAVAFDAKAQRDRLATKAELLRALKLGGLQIIDTRSEAEFCGTAKLSNKRGGAIPGAKHLEWIDLIDKKTQRFKPAGELRKLFADAGISLKKPAATHCQSGGRASVMAFGMELMGAKQVSNYYPGWSEWGNLPDTPIVPGKVKEKE